MGVADFQPAQANYPPAYVPAGLDMNYTLNSNGGLNGEYGRSTYTMPHHLPQNDGQDDTKIKSQNEPSRKLGQQVDYVNRK